MKEAARRAGRTARPRRRPGRRYHHDWRVGDLLMWDERATMHKGAGDYRPDERRIMLRTIVYPN